MKKKLIFRNYPYQQNLFILIGFVFFIFLMVGVSKNNIINGLLIFLPFNLLLFNEAYGKSKSTLDAQHLLVFPINIDKLYLKLLLFNLIHFQAIMIFILILFLLKFHLFQTAIMSILIYLSTIQYFTIYNILIKRYLWAYQLFVRIHSGFISVIVMPVVWINFANEKFSWLINYLIFFEKNFEKYSFFYILIISVEIIVFYFLSRHMLRRTIYSKLFPNNLLLEKHGKFFI